MRDAPLVSIVVAAHVVGAPQARLLDETLDTVAAQHERSHEVIVVDDGSPVDVAAVVARHPRARCLRQANAGPARARNTGIAAARGAHLVFLDADDHLTPHALDAGLAALAARPDCDMVVGPREDMTHDGHLTGVRAGLPPAGQDLYVTLLAFDWYIIPPSSCLFRRAAIDDVGGFRDPWGPDDLDLYLRVVRRGPAWCHAGEPVTRYRRYPESTSRDGERMLRGLRTVYEREWPHCAGDPAREAAWHLGLGRLVDIFQRALVENVEVRLAAGRIDAALRAARLLARENPPLFAAAAGEGRWAERLPSLAAAAG